MRTKAIISINKKKLQLAELQLENPLKLNPTIILENQKALVDAVGLDKAKEATDKARAHMVPFPPSSPSMALFKDGELVHMLERHHIEGRPAEMIAENLMDAYNEFC